MDEKAKMKEELEKGLELLKEGHNEEAATCFEAIVATGGFDPLATCCLGLAMARAGKDLTVAEEYCLKAIEKKPYTGEFYRSLAEVYFIGGKKAEAIQTLDKGLKYDSKNKELYREMKKYGIRKRPPIPFLSRSNFFNKKIGKLLSKL